MRRNLIKIAFLGATSQISMDLILCFQKCKGYKLLLYARNVEKVKSFLYENRVKRNIYVAELHDYGLKKHDCVINFIGTSSPLKTNRMGASILDVTDTYDQIIIEYLRFNPETKYIFLSSGAVFGTDFQSPVTNESKSILDVNDIHSDHYYALAKIYAEAKHRALSQYKITDLRIFSYWSNRTDLNSKFFLSELVYAAKYGRTFETSKTEIYRDYIHKLDLLQLILLIVEKCPANSGIDCYSRSFISKSEVLKFYQEKYNLNYKFKDDLTFDIRNEKLFYYSTDKSASKIGYRPLYSSIDVISEFSKHFLEVADG